MAGIVRRASRRRTWPYGISHITRHVVHDVLRYDWYFVKKDQLGAERREAILQIKALLPDFAELGAQHGFRFVLLLHPRTVLESIEGTYLWDFDQLLADAEPARSGIEVVDMLAYCRAHRIMIEGNAIQYYWRRDGHFNTEGYAVMGRAAASELLARELVPALQ
jgi:hypothetical protein